MPEIQLLKAIVDRTLRVYSKGLIYANEAAQKIMDEVDYEMSRSDAMGHIEWLIKLIPDLPDPIQTELKNIAQTSDDTIFVRNVFVSGPYPPPKDWKPAPFAIRSSVDYDADSPVNKMHLNDGTTSQVDATEPWPRLIFALREYFSVGPEIAG